MTRQEAVQLFKKYNEGLASARERNALEQWYHQEQSRQRLNEREADFFFLRDELWRRTQDQAGLNKIATPVQLPKPAKLWRRIAVAAAAVAVVTLGTWAYYSSGLSGYRYPGDTKEYLTYTKDIAPGKNGATLTLSTGQVIALSSAQSGVEVRDALQYMDGTEIAAVTGKDPLTMTAVTGPAQTYQVRLSDGTRVWLNAGSKISFPSRFTGTQRRVSLEGEAYFEVAHHKSNPFIVQNGQQTIEVLGTHFNINSYTDEGLIKTTLLEGSVRVHHAGRPQDNIVLKPGQQSLLKSGRMPDIKEVNTAEAIAWKNGLFQFNDAGIETIMRQLGRWYDVTVVYENGKPSGTYQGQIPRNVKLSKVLEMLSYAGIKFTIENKTLTVKQ